MTIDFQLQHKFFYFVRHKLNLAGFKEKLVNKSPFDVHFVMMRTAVEEAGINR